MKRDSGPGRAPEIEDGGVNLERRGFVKTAALIGIATIVTGIPVASYVIAPALKKGSGKWVDLGAADEVEDGKVTMRSYEFMVKDGWLNLPQRGFVWAKAEGQDKITVFSPTCTHLGCNAIWREESGGFECPCHSGRYDAMGKPISGPPTKPLLVLNHKIEQGRLMVLINT